ERSRRPLNTVLDARRPPGPDDLGARKRLRARAPKKASMTCSAQDAELRKVASEVLLETMRDPNAKPSDRLAAARALSSHGPTKPAPASGAEDVSGGYVRHDPERILAMLREVGLVAPALLGQAIPTDNA